MLKFITTFVLLVPLVTANEAELQERIDALTAQNKRLVKTVQILEKRITNLEQKGIKHNVPARRQSDGPWTFSYRRDATRQTFKRNDPIVFPNKITDLGGGYDNTTGIYTAPHAGLYMITCSVLADHNSPSSPQLHASIMVDGVAKANVFAYSENGSGTGHHRDQGSSTIFVMLNQGSRVWVKVIDQDHVTVGGDRYSLFSGYLLWQS
ncbi:hypothetical protein ACF0H5_000863 [Mactra antiquata]